MRSPAIRFQRLVWRDSGFSESSRLIPDESAIALTYNGGTYAVMMASPQNFEDFAIGFSLTEGIVHAPTDIRSFELLSLDDGIELRMWLDPSNAERLSERRRHIAGVTGCGLCGIESIIEATRPATVVGGGREFSPTQIMSAMQGMPPLQTLNAETRAVHAAAFWTPEQGVIALREDVGRHNALDKLAGALARQVVEADSGIVLLTSRVSVEMVQKTAAIGASVMVSVSAPTALAVKMADKANITLAAIARADGFEIFTHPDRILSADGVHVVVA